MQQMLYFDVFMELFNFKASVLCAAIEWYSSVLVTLLLVIVIICTYEAGCICLQAQRKERRRGGGRQQTSLELENIKSSIFAQWS